LFEGLGASVQRRLTVGWRAAEPHFVERLQRKITDRLAGFEVRYNDLAEPFDWTFTGDDLEDLLARVAAHDPADPALLPAAAA
jgi:hypothetical protein